MKKILILGAGVYQVPLIECARQRGLWVAVASCNGDDPGMSLAHQSWVIDTTDREELLALARENQIDAVATTGTDVALPSLGYLSEAMGLPGIDYQTGLHATNKILMQKRFAAAKVPAAKHQPARSFFEAQEAAPSIGFPVIVKPPDSSGSRGVSVVEDPDQLGPAFDAALAVSRTGEVLVEEFLTGEEFGAQVIVVEGEVIHCFFHNDTVTPPPVTVPIGHSCPSRLPTSIQSEAARVCNAAVKALGITNAVCNVDLVATPCGVRVLEIGARAGATGIPEIIRLHYGVDLYDVVLEMALGRRPRIEIAPQRAAAVLLLRAPATGRLVRCRVPPEVRRRNRLIRVDFDYSEGDTVHKFHTGPDRIGDVLVVSDSAENADTQAAEIAGMLDVEIRSGHRRERPLRPLPCLAGLAEKGPR